VGLVDLRGHAHKGCSLPQHRHCVWRERVVTVAGRSVVRCVAVRGNCIIIIIALLSCTVLLPIVCGAIITREHNTAHIICRDSG
jgi:hypothetical protein